MATFLNAFHPREVMELLSLALFFICACCLGITAPPFAKNTSKERLRVCILSPIYPHKDDMRLGIFVHEQAKYLAREGADVTVVTLGGTNDPANEVKDGVRISRVRKRSFPLGSVLFAASLLARLACLHRRKRFSLVHAHFVGSLTAMIGMTCRVLNIPLVLTVHGIGLLTKNPLGKALLRFYLSFPDRIVCVSKYVGALAGQHAKKDKIVVVLNGIDPEKLTPSIGARAFRQKMGMGKRAVLLSVAGLVQRKGIDVVLKALSSLKGKHSDFIYVIIGRGPEEANLKKLSASLGIGEKVRFIGFLPGNELANYYNSCDIFILMSRTLQEEEGVEGFGIAYIEASYFGKPVIGGKSGGTADSIVDGVTGFRIPPRDTAMLEQTLVRLLSDAALQKKMGEAGRKRTASTLLWSKNAKILLRIYSSLLKN